MRWHRERARVWELAGVQQRVEETARRVSVCIGTAVSAIVGHIFCGLVGYENRYSQLGRFDGLVGAQSY